MKHSFLSIPKTFARREDYDSVEVPWLGNRRKALWEIRGDGNGGRVNIHEGPSNLFPHKRTRPSCSKMLLQ